MADRYWVGGSATWNANAANKWATTSGGVGGASVPTSSDDVYFNASSGSALVIVDTAVTRSARSITFTGFTGTFSASALGGSPIEISRDLTFNAPGMAFNYNAGFKFTPNAATGTITGDLKLIGNNDLEIVATGGGTVVISDQCNFKNVTLSQGTLSIGAGVVVSVTGLTATGLYPTTINSTSAGVQGVLYKSSGTVTVSNVSIQDNDATGGATWNASNGTNTNLGNNTGWVFPIVSSGNMISLFM
jgi:hypothetical protein